MVSSDDMEKLVRKFVSNRISEEELDLVQEYLSRPEGLACLERMMEEHRKEFVVPSMVISHVSDVSERKTIHRRYYLAAAASFAAVCVAISVYLFSSQHTDVVTYHTRAGQRLDITLPDQSTVVLNERSSLSVRGDWASQRDIDLEGEAYFKIVSNPSKPLLVHADGIDIKVLGTTFNVKSYRNEPMVETTLVEGKVLVEEQGNSKRIAELHPNQKALFRKDDHRIALLEAEPTSEASWLRGVLVFEDKAFGEIIRTLERHYDVKITVNDVAALGCRFNATIEKETLDEVLNLFGSQGKMKYHINGPHEVVIEGSVCGS